MRCSDTNYFIYDIIRLAKLQELCVYGDMGVLVTP